MIRERTCGSQTLIEDGKDAVCMCCGYRIEDYKKKSLEMSKDEYKLFERGISKNIHGFKRKHFSISNLDKAIKGMEEFIK